MLRFIALLLVLNSAVSANSGWIVGFSRKYPPTAIDRLAALAAAVPRCAAADGDGSQQACCWQHIERLNAASAWHTDFAVVRLRGPDECVAPLAAAAFRRPRRVRGVWPDRLLSRAAHDASGHPPPVPRVRRPRRRPAAGGTTVPRAPRIGRSDSRAGAGQVAAAAAWLHSSPMTLLSVGDDNGDGFNGTSPTSLHDVPVPGRRLQQQQRPANARGGQAAVPLYVDALYGAPALRDPLRWARFLHSSSAGASTSSSGSAAGGSAGLSGAGVHVAVMDTGVSTAGMCDWAIYRKRTGRRGAAGAAASSSIDDAFDGEGAASLFRNLVEVTDWTNDHDEAVQPAGDGHERSMHHPGASHGHADGKAGKARADDAHRSQRRRGRPGEDVVGHGTFVAGTIGSIDARCAGMAPDVSLHVYRLFTTQQTSYTSWFLDAANHALATGVHIVSLSVGGPDTSDEPFGDKIREMLAAGILIVSAIGNEGPGWGTVYSPADMVGVLGVGGAASGGQDVVHFSSRGPTLSINGAIGTGQLWTVQRIKPDVVAFAQHLLGPALDGGCRKLSGTSVAAPSVAGAAALLYELARTTVARVAPTGLLTPGAAGAVVHADPRLVSSRVLQALMGSATRMPLPQRGWAGAAGDTDAHVRRAAECRSGVSQDDVAGPAPSMHAQGAGLVDVLSAAALIWRGWSGDAAHNTAAPAAAAVGTLVQALATEGSSSFVGKGAESIVGLAGSITVHPSEIDLAASMRGCASTVPPSLQQTGADVEAQRRQYEQSCKATCTHWWPHCLQPLLWWPLNSDSGATFSVPVLLNVTVINSLSVAATAAASAHDAADDALHRRLASLRQNFRPWRLATDARQLRQSGEQVLVRGLQRADTWMPLDDAAISVGFVVKPDAPTTGIHLDVGVTAASEWQATATTWLGLRLSARPESKGRSSGSAPACSNGYVALTGTLNVWAQADLGRADDAGEWTARAAGAAAAAGNGDTLLVMTTHGNTGRARLSLLHRVSVPISALVACEAPLRSQRVLFDSAHSLSYPHGSYIPRDDLDAIAPLPSSHKFHFPADDGGDGDQLASAPGGRSSGRVAEASMDPLEWKGGDSLFGNYAWLLDRLRSRGYVVADSRQPLSCLHRTGALASFGTIAIIDPEDDWLASEKTALVRVAQQAGIGLVVAAEWHDPQLTPHCAGASAPSAAAKHAAQRDLTFLDENIHARWRPVVCGGANVPALNGLLAPFGVQFNSGAIYTGAIPQLASHVEPEDDPSFVSIPFSSGTGVRHTPLDAALWQGGSSVSFQAELHDHSAWLAATLASSGGGDGHQMDAMRGTVPHATPAVLMFKELVATGPGRRRTRVAAFGDTACLDASDTTLVQTVGDATAFDALHMCGVLVDAMFDFAALGAVPPPDLLGGALEADVVEKHDLGGGDASAGRLERYHAGLNACREEEHKEHAPGGDTGDLGPLHILGGAGAFACASRMREPFTCEG